MIGIEKRFDLNLKFEKHLILYYLCAELCFNPCLTEGENKRQQQI